MKNKYFIFLYFYFIKMWIFFSIYRFNLMKKVKMYNTKSVIYSSWRWYCGYFLWNVKCNLKLGKMFHFQPSEYSIQVYPLRINRINFAWFFPDWTLRLLPSRTTHISLGTSSAQNLFLFPIPPPPFSIIIFPSIWLQWHAET